MLELKRLNLAIGGHPVLRDVGFDVAEGELLCLLGPSGCGKTTSLRLIAGLERPDSGTITMAGKALADDSLFVPPHRRGIGFLFQDVALFPHLDVIQNIAFGLAGKKSKAHIARRVDAMLEQMRLREHAHKYPHMLSGGQQQRVALARALAPEPRLLLLDEPFSSLDARLRSQIREETREVLEQTGVTTLMVTHDWEEAMLLADRIALMRDGHIVQVGTPAELYRAPVDPFAAEFVGELNRVEGFVEGDWVRTPLGCLANRRLPSGTPVEVLIRPEALRPGEARADAKPVRVCSVQFAGSDSLVQLGLEKHTKHVQARFPASRALAVGDYIHVDIDPEHTFVFPKGR